MLTLWQYSQLPVVPHTFHRDAATVLRQTDFSLALVASSDRPVVLSSFHSFLLSGNGQREFLISPMACSSKAVLPLKGWQVCFLGTGEQGMKERKKDMRLCNKEQEDAD